MFNQLGDLERRALRPGNVHSADCWREVLEPVIARYRDKMKRRYFRDDQVDTPVMPFLRCQRGSPSAPCIGLRHQQLHANPGDVRGSGVVVPDEFAGEADHDRRQGGQPRRLRHVPNGGGRSAAIDAPRHPAADRPTAGAAGPQHEGRWDRMRQTTTAEVRLDEGKTTSSAAR